jgi:integrase
MGRLRDKRSGSPASLVRLASDLVKEVRAELRKEFRLLNAEKRAPVLKTICDLAAEWLPRKTKLIASGKDFRRRVENHILPGLGHHTAATLKKRDVEAFLLELLEGGLSEQTVNHVRDHGRQLVEDAIDNDDWPSSNPFAKTKTLKIPETDKDILSRPEAALLLASIPTRWRPLFALALYLGPRRSSIFNVRPWDVDFASGVISFNKTKTGKAIKRIPIPDELVPHLREAMSCASKDWLFVSRNGTRHTRDSKSLRRVLARALKSAGIRRADGLVPHITFHGLRRVSSVLHQEADCHPWVVSKILGHSQASLALFGSVLENTTAKKYTVFSEQFVRQELNRLTLVPT